MKLSDVVNRINGNVDRFTTDLEYYVGGEHFDSNELAVTRKGMLKENLNVLGFKFHFAFQKRDVLFMARNPHLRKAGMVMFDGLCSDATYILRSKDENVLLQEYLALQLQSDHFWNYCESHKVGSVNFANNWTSIANYEFDLPSIEEQKVLADKLWAAYKVKESYRQLLSTTDEMLKAKFQEMFGDGKWEQKKWSDVLSVLNGKAYPAEYQESGTYPIYGSGGIMAYGEKKLCEGNTIIIGRKGNINNPIFVKDPYWAVDTAFSISVKPEFLVPIYMYFWCKNFDFNVYNKQGVLPSLTKSDLENIIMGIPPIDMQKEFASIYIQAEATKASLRASIEAIDRVIRSLINQ